MESKNIFRVIMRTPGLRDIVAGYWFMARKVLRIPSDALVELHDDHVAPFDEYHNCLICRSDKFQDVFEALDKMKVQECLQCGLWQTRPRINKKVWEAWLRTSSDRGQKYTENRLTYGYALDEHIKFSSSLWRWRIKRHNISRLQKILAFTDYKPIKMHDIGCGVGFFLCDARDSFGFQVSGNDLNRYAVEAMRDRFGLDVVLGLESEPEVLDRIAKADLITMTDVIEHVYEPLTALQVICDAMKPSACLYLTTFHIDCEIAQKHGAQWDMHCWNHVSHFSQSTLERLVQEAGFQVKKSSFPDFNPECELMLVPKKKKTI